MGGLFTKLLNQIFIIVTTWVLGALVIDWIIMKYNNLKKMIKNKIYFESEQLYEDNNKNKVSE